MGLHDLNPVSHAIWKSALFICCRFFRALAVSPSARTTLQPYPRLIVLWLGDVLVFPTITSSDWEVSDPMKMHHMVSNNLQPSSAIPGRPVYSGDAVGDKSRH